MNEFFQEWAPDPREEKLYEILKRYHDECEAYDRTVCTGPITSAGIMPITPHELGLVNRFASQRWRSMLDETDMYGFTLEQIRHVNRRFS